MIRSHRERLSEARLRAERWIGYCPEDVQRSWDMVVQEDELEEDCHLVDVEPKSEEFSNVSAVFRAQPRDPPAYSSKLIEAWDNVRVHRVERVENWLQMLGSVKPYVESLRKCLREQELEFEPGVHSIWAFHAADSSTIESIISNPVPGFVPTASSSRGSSSLWGAGVYFARDARYVADCGFCGPPAADGTRRMLMCLLNVGVPCLGDAEHKGVLPYRQKPYRYNCSVDALSSPELYIMPHPASAYPAYLITFVI